MDFIFDLLHAAMPVLYVIGAIALLLKVILVFYYKGFDLPALVISLFKIYTPSKRNAASARRKSFMRYNNLINYYLYALLLLFLLMLIVFQGNIFSY